MDWYQSFFMIGQLPSDAMIMTGTYNPYLVLLSYIIASLASYVALDMSSHLKRENTKVFKFWWWAGGSIVMGAGIWSMHFIGMLAFKMDMPMSYDIAWTAISMIIAVITAGFAFLFFMIKDPKPIHYVLSGIILGLAIPSMHYTGMAGMAGVEIHYYISLFIASILIAVIAAVAALWLSGYSDKGTYTRRIQLKIVSALIMGFAICGMHYMGMHAAVFIHQPMPDTTALYADPNMLSIVIATIVISILCVALILSTTKYYVSNKIQNDKLFLEVILNSMRGGILAFDAAHNLRLYNRASEDLFNNLEHYKFIATNWEKVIPLLKPDNKAPFTSDDYPLNRIFNGEIVKSMEVLAINNFGKERILAIDGQKLKGPEGDDLGAVMIYQDITERKQIDQMKNEFISTVSHELRTPLTSIRGSLGLIMGGAMGTVPQEMSTLLEIACNNSERLVRLINDILDTEKIESGKMVFHYNRTDLSKILEQAVISNKAYADKYKVTYKIDKMIPGLQVMLDADRIRQVIDNLLSNAAKFSKPDGIVTINMNRDGNTVRVSVSDTGNGIPQEFQSKLFSKFYQADSSDNREKGGTGLGLSICKAIIESHKGSIGFTSKVNEGTTFYFDLPLPQETSKEEFISGEISKTKRILVCEDDPDVSKLLGLILKDRGFSSVRVGSIAEAKQALEKQDFGLMTLDLLLPDGYGLDLLQWMRTRTKLQKLPVVIISAVSIEEEKLKGSALGIVDWINKPIDEPRLYKDVIQALGFKPGTSKHKILHVEDDADIAKIVGKVLNDISETDVAGSISEAKRKLNDNKYELIVLDLNLKDGTGYELLAYLEESGLMLPVVILSVDDVEANVSKNIVASMVKSKVSNADILEKILSIIDKDET